VSSAAFQGERRTFIFAPNLGWADVPLRMALEDRLAIPAHVLNDVRAAAWAEWRFGAGTGCGDVVAVFVGTGVGGAVVSGGRMLEGAGNAAGELGHLTVVAGGRTCRCANQGCLEAYVGGWAIAERANLAAEDDPAAGARLHRLAGSPGQVTAAHVTRAAKHGDPLAIQLLSDTADHLAAGLVGIVNAFNPAVLVLGGGVLESIPELIDAVRPKVLARVLPSAAEGLRIVPARLGGQAGAVGAAAFARAEILGDRPIASVASSAPTPASTALRG
jgi:glucokinase